jgi:5-methylcytosine-specific restriction endonuclease McrA
MGRLYSESNVQTIAENEASGSICMGQESEVVAIVTESQAKSATRQEIRDLITRQNYRCALSGVELTPDNAEIDHVIAVKNGGSHDVSNLQVLHVVVNRMKGTISNDEFIRWCRLVSENQRR